uniref:Zf-ISL3 domain-containing protein n=1 Tax=Brugia timori TaxID=42155 RepID=A0A0R3QGW6_9BILA
MLYYKNMNVLIGYYQLFSISIKNGINYDVKACDWELSVHCFFCSRFVNVNRLQTGIDNFGAGRYPFYIEPVVIISITDGNCLTCPQFGAVNEVNLRLVDLFKFVLR